jgi:acylphosphatase
VERRTYYFGGHVQGVGFRYTAQAIARDFRVTGYVRNLPDGHVELIAEGEPDEISRFLETIAQRMDGYIKNRQDMDCAATGEFKSFSVRS